MANKHSIPCYVTNGGVHDVVNIPLGMWQRIELRKLIRELLTHQKNLVTILAANATPQAVQVLKGLYEILGLDLRPQATRGKATALLTENEKNLKQSAKQVSESSFVNLVSFSVSCGLIAILFLVAAHIEYLSNL